MPENRFNRKDMRQLLAVLVVMLAAALLYGETRDKAILLSVNDAIGPAIADYIERGLDKANDAGAEIVIIQLDTPGGLDLSMRSIIRAIIASPVPVAIHVAPPGARAASAGTYMMYAAHVAAMAPGTNLGAATPVQMGGMPGMEPPAKPAPGAADDEAGSEAADKDEDKDAPKDPLSNADAMTKKIVNDAAAYIRSLAEMRGRNAEWAEQAVREGVSLSSEQALEAGVIDIIAGDIADLLQQVNGRTVSLQNGERTLNTGGLIVEAIEPDWRNELLAIITNPNIAYILMLLGIYGLFFELANPGYVLPGVIGGVSLLLALYALQVLPVNYAGLGLMFLGIALIVGELFMPSFGILGIGGIVSFVLGSILLFDRESGNIAVSMPLIIAVSVLSAGFFLIVIRSLYASRQRPVVAGSEELIGATGRIAADFSGTGVIYIHGEQWNAQSDTPMRGGDNARVTGRDGLILHVEPAPEESS